MSKNTNLQLLSGPEEKRTVPVTEETEPVRERVVVDGPPVAADESGDEKDQGALGLVEIGHQHVHHPEAKTGHNDDAGVEFQLVETVPVQV